MASYVTYTKRALYDVFKKSKKELVDEKIQEVEDDLVKKVRCPAEELSEFRRCLRHFKSELRSKWISARYDDCRFGKKNEQWLSGKIKVKTWTSQKSKMGRPSKNFSNLSERMKRQRTEGLRNNVDKEELAFAAQMSYRAAGNSGASKLIKEASVDPSQAAKYEVAVSDLGGSKTKKHTPSEALAIFVGQAFETSI
ncbi:unnamed protein product [Bemisia tabaci]|uniref:Uncharacterized protein n=1 Tax=Bemisia tabaci TaxID=7038 RepID=A0A9P0A7A9_BEMTA|nr:unnamed protein product [Bemisia tabaci]